ncbi:cell wall-binding repeat-containing protein [Proteiniborus sp. MB09-C3]|uniref:cell wall-binding repeat-containing protein n=1 Tax=Proteiniborus sp. MB09-C3 TaxID=3050072 RepID=UPI00255650C5|nr:cell wall-binding repeat-containing protein [Proteiniborus sp. MB09-C3]WIV11146.1 cell wall-binding repeat-containing protein [Proteiniborus sp. MB09-C3]
MNSDKALDTLNTTRICGGNIFENAIAISDIVYADKSPNSVIIANGDLYQDAFAATPLIHFPRNAPILFSHANYIDPSTVSQIFKLQPKGVDGVHVFIVGGISYGVEYYLSTLGLKVKRISGTNFFDTSAKIAEYLGFPQNIMIVSSEDYREGLSACAWAAHMGDIILFATRDELPIYTRNVILRTKNANVFIIGSTNMISKNVEMEIKKLNPKFVDRISGYNPYDVSVNFAKYKSPDGKFGWGKTNRDGHAFTFTSIQNPFNSVSAALFAHLGKHAPILVVNKDIFPEITRNYIESVKPQPKPEPHPPFMHGWIVGCSDTISVHVQLEIERSLSIDEFHAGM